MRGTETSTTNPVFYIAGYRECDMRHTTRLLAAALRKRTSKEPASNSGSDVE
jgi:hypothetical protein